MRKVIDFFCGALILSETGRIRFRGARFQTPSSVSFLGLTRPGHSGTRCCTNRPDHDNLEFLAMPKLLGTQDPWFSGFLVGRNLLWTQDEWFAFFFFWDAQVFNFWGTRPKTNAAKLQIDSGQGYSKTIDCQESLIGILPLIGGGGGAEGGYIHFNEMPKQDWIETQGSWECGQVVVDKCNRLSIWSPVVYIVWQTKSIPGWNMNAIFWVDWGHQLQVKMHSWRKCCKQITQLDSSFKSLVFWNCFFFIQPDCSLF